MTKSSPLIFFGSGPVALANLQALAEHFTIELVITKPKSPRQKDQPLVLAWATAAGLDVKTTADRAELDALFQNMDKKSAIGVVVDFGIIISDAVINTFELGIVNSHFSLLPKLRGADPITFALLEGHSITGVSLMKIVPALDEGPVLDQTSFTIPATETGPQLTDHLVALSQQRLIEILPKYIAGDIKPYEQDRSITPTYSRKLTKNDGQIDWQKPAIQLEREVRALLAWPKSHAIVDDREIIITEARVHPIKLQPGAVASYDGVVMVGCGEDSLELVKLKVPGKPEMSGSAFADGYLKTS